MACDVFRGQVKSKQKFDKEGRKGRKEGKGGRKGRKEMKEGRREGREGGREGSKHFEDPGIDGTVILNLTLSK